MLLKIFATKIIPRKHKSNLLTMIELPFLFFFTSNIDVYIVITRNIVISIELQIYLKEIKLKLSFYEIIQ
jgi:hypothetical protein